MCVKERGCEGVCVMGEGTGAHFCGPFQHLCFPCIPSISHASCCNKETPNSGLLSMIKLGFLLPCAGVSVAGVFHMFTLRSRLAGLWSFLRLARGWGKEREKMMGEVPVGRAWKCSLHFCPHSLGHNSVTWLPSTTSDIGQFSSTVCP